MCPHCIAEALIAIIIGIPIVKIVLVWFKTRLKK